VWRSPLRLTESGDTELGNLSALRTNTIDLRIRFGCAPNHNLTIDATELRFFMMDDTAANFGAPIVPLLEKLAHAFALIRNRHLAPRDDMHKIAAALFSASLMVGPASASDDIDVIRTVRRFFDSFNNGDLKSALDICAAQSAIVDEFPPYLWQGATGCADWSKDFDAHAKKNGITDPKVTLGRAHINVTENRAYVVVSANFSFKQNGKRVAAQGSVLTVVLQKDANSWRITGWAWAKRS